ncbi:hypothetical protein D3C78_1166040 [compost metagenome]
MRSISTRGLPSFSCSRLIISMAHLMIVRVRRPRKSNFTRPAASTSSLSNWVTRPAPSSSQAIGAKSVSLVGAITTPPACLPVPRVMPSSFKAMSQISWASSSTLRKSRSTSSWL